MKKAWEVDLGMPEGSAQFYFDEGLDFETLKSRARTWTAELTALGFVQVSRSHTRFQGKSAVAAIAVQSGVGAGVGIDLESAGRTISDPLWQRFARADEQMSYESNRIGLWCLKEACFKADPDPKKSLVTQYFAGDLRFRVAFASHLAWTMAVAVRNESKQCDRLF